MKHVPLSRRTFLRGLGAALPLPFLEAMSPSFSFGATAEAARKNKPPVRFLWLYQANGFLPTAWNPTGTGREFELSRTLKPFEHFKDRLTVTRNLRTRAYGNHIGKVTALLTGVQAERDRKLGVYSSARSIDQQIADHIGRDTLLPSLQLGVEHPGQGYCSGANSPVSYGATVSWKTPTTMLMPEIDPRAAFESLFGAGVGPKAKARARWQGSILDLALDQAKTLRRNATALDKQKLDEYLESVRSVERRLQHSERRKKESWRPSTKPSEKQLAAPPAGIPQDRAEHVRMMLDLIALAIWTDSTRVATMIYVNSLSEANFSFLDGIKDPFHAGLSHHGYKDDKMEGYSKVNEWHAAQSAYLMKRLDDIDEGNGSALDNSVVFFGSSLKDGHAHSNIDLPIACIGRAGGALKPAGHVICPENTHIADLHLTTLGWFGIQANDFNNLGARRIPGLS
ncbi:MAG: hypothetical protein CMO80_13245 [Verrucomicrobiales bacterium]|nr:hypothetical protein [Verrucomicrobiales bacterium]|tara:strand:+ start:5031 stop:6392 length:1362 start_codon:yes stop_codon:yes gene_type:complete